MISVDEAWRLIAATLQPLGAENTPLDAAAGRTLAADVKSRLTHPSFNASAMDGYAVRLADVMQAGSKLTVIGESAAGSSFKGSLGAGEAVRIFTGAAVPTGADHILIQEEALRDGEIVTAKAAQTRAAHVRPAGLDFHSGEVLARKGETLTGPLLALIAAGNVDAVSIMRRPRIAIIANGDELAPPGATLTDDQIVSSIPYCLSPMIAAWGGVAEVAGIARDDPADIDRMIARTLSADLILPVGGASVGDRDYMRAAFSARGAASVFEKVSLKPGKPTWFAAIPDGPFVLGLPGNPASALVTARLFLKAAIGAMLGRADGRDDWFRARLCTAIPPNGPRETFLRARTAIDDNGVMTVTPFENQDSSLLSVMARSDALIRRRAEDAAAPSGAIVDCLWF